MRLGPLTNASVLVCALLLTSTQAEAKPKKFEHRWSDAEIAALWQSMAFRVEYRCFNCVATCPAEIEDVLQAHPSVGGAQVVGVATPGGTKAFAFVIPAAGAAFDEQALMAHCAA